MVYKDKEKEKKYKKLYYLQNKEKILEKVRKHSKEKYWENVENSRKKKRDKLLEMKLKLFEFLGGKCSNSICLVPGGCKDHRCLQIDHVKGGGNKEHGHAKSGSFSYYLRVLNAVKNGSKDYQLLCSNCNWIKRWENHEL